MWLLNPTSATLLITICVSWPWILGHVIACASLGKQGFVWLVLLGAEHGRSLGHLVACTSKKGQGKPPGTDEILLTVQCIKKCPGFLTSPDLQE